MRTAVAACALLFLAACSSSASASPATRSKLPTTAPSAAHYATAAEAVAASCVAFSHFFDDLNALTPHGSQIKLVADAQAVLSPLIHTDATLSGKARKLFNDANTFVMHIGSSDWPTNGTPIDREITDVQEDCA